jgi:hypothetical protein
VIFVYKKMRLLLGKRGGGDSAMDFLKRSAGLGEIYWQDRRAGREGDTGELR